MSTLKLEKQAVAAAVAQSDTWDVVGWLEEQASREMPQNVRIELVEWVKRADIFTLYPDLDLVEDYLGLDAVAEVATHSVNEYLFLVPERMQIADTLRAAGQVVLNILHSHDQVAPVPESSVFVQPPPEPDEPETLVVQQTTAITLTFPHLDGLRVVRQRLLDARCPVMSNEQAQSLTFPAGYQAVLAQVIADVAEHYQITLVEESS